MEPWRTIILEYIKEALLPPLHRLRVQGYPQDFNSHPRYKAQNAYMFTLPSVLLHYSDSPTLPLSYDDSYPRRTTIMLPTNHKSHRLIYLLRIHNGVLVLATCIVRPRIMPTITRRRRALGDNSGASHFTILEE